jgi:FkbM family methyltransferase
MSYKDLLKTRDEDVDGISEWLWVKEDNGAWDGPKEDWLHSHKQTYLNHVKHFDVVVCAGGNCGLYARLFSQMFKWVYTFEPDPLNFHCLVNNCQLDNVVKFQCALGQTNKMVAIQRSTMSNVGMHTVVDHDEAMVAMQKLDNFDFPRLDLIQLDVEGHEIHVLQGAVETIKRLKPVITAERGDSREIRDLMQSLGYENKGHTKADTIWVPK